MLQFKQELFQDSSTACVMQELDDCNGSFWPWNLWMNLQARARQRNACLVQPPAGFLSFSREPFIAASRAQTAYRSTKAQQESLRPGPDCSLFLWLTCGYSATVWYGFWEGHSVSKLLSYLLPFMVLLSCTICACSHLIFN